MLHFQSASSASERIWSGHAERDSDQCLSSEHQEPVRIGDMELRMHAFQNVVSGAREGLQIGSSPALVLVTEGEAEFSQAGRHVMLGSGHWTLARGELLVAAEEHAGIMIVQLGKDFSLQSPEQLRSYMLCRNGAEGGAGRMVYLHAAGMIDIGRNISMGCGQEMAAITAHLVRLALMEASAARPLATMRDTLRLRIRTFIERNLHNPDLSIDSIAARFNCSKRNLHKVFQDEGDTLNRFLWSTRLDRCKRDLMDPMLRHKSITEVAFSWGFNSSAHFSRAFRARFDAAPRALRP